MPRPLKCRLVNFLPDVTFFKPAGIPLRMLDEVVLNIEELEAIRLKDLDGLEQEECAEKMRISRPTFHRVLEASRRKIADALTQGKAIRIEGGNFKMSQVRFRCTEGHEWDVPFDDVMNTPPQLCSVCNSSDIVSLQPFGQGCGRIGGRYRRGRG